MNLAFKYKYEKMTDRQLVELAFNREGGGPVNEEGIVYLIYERYNPLLHSLYMRVFDAKYDFYEDCLGDLYNYLHGGSPAWRKLMNFEWRSSFGAWLKPTAYNRFLEIKPSLIGKLPRIVSISEKGDGKSVERLPEGDINDRYRQELRIMVLEAISMLRDEDEKFVMLKRLEGYNSKEIALLLQDSWTKRGIAKYSYKNKVRTLVVPDAAYVDVKTQRGKVNLRSILKDLI